MSEAKGPLAGLLVLDLSRILAGPTCTQLLGDLGADVIKIERPGKGDDTRAWGPPFLENRESGRAKQSAYYMCANRNKRSLALDIATEDGQRIIREIAAKADILIENYKVGDLKRRGLDYESLKAINPRLVYCSISGFGQTGPYAKRAGYDFLIQGMGGIMSITGEPDGRPLKTGLGIADVMCGMYASSAILSAIHHRHTSGKGQYIDLGLLDTQIAWLINQGTAYLVSGETPGRLGNGHPTIVPYDTVPSSDGDFIIAVGNDGQFQRMCAVLGAPEWGEDARFLTNSDRVANRDLLMAMVSEKTATETKAHWIEKLEEATVPCGPVNTIHEAFTDPQAVHRGMTIEMESPVEAGEPVRLIGNPIKMSETPVTYRRPPPRVGQHSRDVLASVLGLDAQDIDRLVANGVIGEDG